MHSRRNYHNYSQNQNNDISLNCFIKNYIEDQLKVHDKDACLDKRFEFDNLSNKSKRRNRILVDFDSNWEVFSSSNSYSTELNSGGGDWNHSKNIYFHLNKSCQSYGLDLIIFFNGTIPKCFDTYEWLNKYKLAHKRVEKNYQNPRSFSKVKPPFLNEYIQLLIHSNNSKSNMSSVFAFQTLENHQKEIIQFYKTYNCDGIITDDFDLISMCIFDSSVDIDLYWAKTFRFHNYGLSANKIDKTKIVEALQMNMDQFKWFAFLLSSQTTQVMSGEWLTEFYKRVTKDSIDLKIPTETSYKYLISQVDEVVHRFIASPIPMQRVFRCVFNRTLDEIEEKDYMSYAESFLNASATLHNFKQKWKFSLGSNNSNIGASYDTHHSKKSTKSYANTLGSMASLSTIQTNKRSTNFKETSTPRASICNLNLSFNCQEIKPTKPFLFVEDYLQFKELNSTLINESVTKIDSLTLIEEDDQAYLELLSLTESFKDKHINSSMHKWIYHAYFKKKIVLPIYSEPDNDYVAMKCIELYRPIRLYCYRLLFSGMKKNFDLDDYNKNNENLICSISSHELNQAKSTEETNNILVEEIVYEPKLKLMKTVPLNVQPLTQEFDIENLWKKSQRERLEQFLFNLNSKYLIDMFLDENERPIIKNNFDECFVVPCLVLRFLLLKNYLILTSKDIDAFITTFIWINKSNYNHEKEKDKLKNKKNDPRCAHLATIFLAGIEHLYFANDVCGRPVKDDCFNLSRYFSGVFFQIAYENYSLNNTNFLKELNHDNQINYIKHKQLFSRLHAFIMRDLNEKVIDEAYYKPYENENFPLTKQNYQRKQNGTMPSKMRSIGRGLLGIQKMNTNFMNTIEPNEESSSDIEQFENPPEEKPKQISNIFSGPVKCTVFANKDLLDQIIEEKKREQTEKNRDAIEKRFGRVTRFGEKCIGGINLPNKVIELIPKAQDPPPEPEPKKEGTTWIPLSDIPMFIMGGKIY